jgi:hypothetical protein
MKGKLNLSDEQVRQFGELLQDFAAKYDTACADFKAGRKTIVVPAESSANEVFRQ